jgi:hypothetical protein
MSESAKEFVPSPRSKDCSKKAGGWGVAMNDFEYIWYGNKGEDDYPDDACRPFYHKSAQIDNIQVNTEVTGGAVNMTGEVKSNGGGHVLSNKKNLPFDMPHPNKKGWRLRHVCIEGPEIAVYCRGKIPTDGVINLPEFWHGLVDPEDMSISLTPRGRWQELFVKEIRWGKQVIVQNNSGGQMEGDYYIVARRLDDDLVVEYEGQSHEDYPGGNEGYSFNFEHNYVRGLIESFVKENLDKES